MTTTGLAIFIWAGLVLLTGSSVAASHEARVDQALTLYQSGRYAEAEKLLSSIEGGGPQEQAEVLFHRGRCHLRARRWKDAVQVLQGAVKMRPRHGPYHLWLGRAYGERASRVVFFKAFGLARKVVREFEKARELSPDDTDVRFDLLEYYLEAPGVVGGSKEKARKEATEIARIDPRQGYAARAMLFAKENDLRSVRQELESAVLAFPSDPATHLDLAEFFFEQDEFAGAESSANSALALDSSSARARFFVYASRISQAKDLESAERAFERLSLGPLGDSDPSFAAVHRWLGQSRLLLGRKAEARQAFQTALRFDPDLEEAKEAISRTR